MATPPSEAHRPEPRDDYPHNVERERRTHGHAPGGDGRPEHVHAPDGDRTAADDGDWHARQAQVRNPVHDDGGLRLIRPAESDDLRRRWESIQASFIDEPREAVHEADGLVSELTDRIAERFRSERSGLEERWDRGDEVSTEELRLTLQQYRAFFDRLLQL